MVGMYARAGTPPAVLDKIAAEAIAAVKTPETQKQLAAPASSPSARDGAAFGKYLAAEADHVGKVIETAGIKVE